MNKIKAASIAAYACAVLIASIFAQVLERLPSLAHWAIAAILISALCVGIVFMFMIIYHGLQGTKD